MDSVLKDAGIDPLPAYKAAGLPTDLAESPQRCVTGTQELTFQQCFVRATGQRPDLWIKAGKRYRVAAYGRLGLALITAPTLKDLVKFSIRGHFNYSLAKSRPIEVDGNLIGQEFDVSAVPPELRDFTIYRDFAAVSTLYAELWNQHFPMRHVSLAVPAPQAEHARMLGYEAVFGAERTAWYWRASVGDAPLFHGDEMLHGIYAKRFMQTLASVQPTDDLIEELYRVMGELGNDRTSLSRIAKSMHVSTRTLQRRLDMRGIKFRNLLDELRKRRAVEMLLSTDTPVSQVAWKIGYSDLASFDHAFRRWTGKSPTSFRGKEDADDRGETGAQRMPAIEIKGARQRPARAKAQRPPRIETHLNNAKVNRCPDPGAESLAVA